MMTIKTWMKEFYPKKPSKRMSRIDAIKHSIRKWEGLTEGNLKKHDVYSSYCNDCLEDDKSDFVISMDTCSLCIKYFDDDCEKCPLYIKLGHSCGSACKTDGWCVWAAKANPDLMIKNLKSLLVDGE